MYWCLTRTGLYLSVECYITCVNLLFSNSRVQSYINRGRLLDLRTGVQTVPPDEDVGRRARQQCPSSKTLGAARPPTSEHDIKLPSPVSD